MTLSIFDNVCALLGCAAFSVKRTGSSMGKCLKMYGNVMRLYIILGEHYVKPFSILEIHSNQGKWCTRDSIERWFSGDLYSILMPQRLRPQIQTWVCSTCPFSESNDFFATSASHLRLLCCCLFKYLTTATRFGAEGVILKLIPAASDDDPSAELPRYLPVDALSAFNEKEWLFGGKNVKFRIKDIYSKSVTKATSSTTAVSALTKMQRLLQNKEPQWRTKELSMIEEYCKLPLASMKNEEQTKRDDLVRLIGGKTDSSTADAFAEFLIKQEIDSDHIEYSVLNDMDLLVVGEYADQFTKDCGDTLVKWKGNKKVKKELKNFLKPKTKELSEFELELFKFFFMQTDIREIEIKNVYGLPDKLRFLFFEDGALSLNPISRLLPMVQSVGFTEFKVDDLRKSRSNFIECIKSWANTHDAKSQKTSQINCIELRSEYQVRDDPFVRELVDKHRSDLEQCGWSLKYKWEEDTHYHRIIAERAQTFQVQITNHIIRQFVLSLSKKPESLMEISVDEKQRAMNMFLGEQCGLNRLKHIRFSVDIVQLDDEESKNDDAIIKFKMTVFGEKDSLKDGVQKIESILTDENITGKSIQIESLSIPVRSIKESSDVSLADKAMRETQKLIATRKKFKEIRDPLRATAVEAKETWTEEREQNVVLRRRELQEQQLQMIKNFMSKVENLLKGNALVEWQQNVLEQVEQLRSRKAFRRYFRSMEMDEVKVRNYYNLCQELQNMFLDVDSEKLSLRFIVDLLPKLRTVSFIDIPVEKMRDNVRDFAGVILKIKEDGKGGRLKEVYFESVDDDERKEEDDVIRKEIEGHKRELNVLRWSLKYVFNGHHHVISMEEGDVNAIEAVGGIKKAAEIALKLKTEGKYKGKRLKAMRGGGYFQMSLGKQCLSLECDAKTVTEDESKEKEASVQTRTATIHLTEDLTVASTFQFVPRDNGVTNGKYFVYGTYQQDEEKGLTMENQRHLLGLFTVEVCVVNDDLWFCTIQKSGEKDGGFWFGDQQYVQYETGLSDSKKDVFIMMEVDCPRHGCIMQ